MKKFLSCFLFLSVGLCQAQLNDHERYARADSLLQAGDLERAYEHFKDLENRLDVQDTLYGYVLWYYSAAVSQLEAKHRFTEQWAEAKQYGLEALALIDKGKRYYYEEYAIREHWMIKNVIVSHFGTNDLKGARKYQDMLYMAYKSDELPDGLDTQYNFEFFTWEGKNIWGYEWYPELGDPETEGSFSKIVYYVYSTNPDGTDKDQLYRLHVLKFHKIDDSVKFDYVLTKRLETATEEVSGTLYAYTYTKPVDYEQLRVDIREVLKGNYE